MPISIDEACVQILDGPCTNMWTFGGTYPGLTIRRPSGQETNVTFTNNLAPVAGELTVHNHGNHSSPDNDGQADDFLIETGASRTYTYDGTKEGGINERGTMQFYHDHRMNATGLNVWMGLTGIYILDDPDDPATLPSGTFELPLAFADRQFDANNQIPYTFDAAGVFGDKVLINGVYQPYIDVGDRKYRLRLLNASNARIYALTLSTGDAFTQIGTESGLLPAPVQRTALPMGPAERLDIIVDFAGKLGQELYLIDKSTTALLKFRVTQHLTDNSTIPSTLRPVPDIGEPTVTRNFSFDRTLGHWTINGLGFDPSRIDAHPVLGTTEKWVFTNPTEVTHMVHIHDVDQQCITRNGGPCQPYETMKETWSLPAGETIELKLKFTDHVGKYMLHCHILEHEDDGMMTQFEVVAPSATPTATPDPDTGAISGTLSYCSNPVPGPVTGAALSLTGGATALTLTDGSGNYSFSTLAYGGSYTVTPTKSALTPGSAGINTVDVVATQRHFLILGTPLTGCRLTAANVNGDATVNTIDVVAIQRFYLALSTGIANVGKYNFTPANRTYLSMVSDQTGQNYDTLIFGDVVTPFADRAGGPSPNAPSNGTGFDEVPATVAAIALPDVVVDKSRTNVIAAVTTSAIDSKNKLVGFQGDFTFDERVVTFESEPVRKAGITGGNWNVAGNVLPGRGPIRTLRISAYSTDFKPLSGSGTLFELEMMKVNKTTQGTQLIWAAPPDHFIFIDADLKTQKQATRCLVVFRAVRGNNGSRPVG